MESNQEKVSIVPKATFTSPLTLTLPSDLQQKNVTGVK